MYQTTSNIPEVPKVNETYLDGVQKQLDSMYNALKDKNIFTKDFKDIRGIEVILPSEMVPYMQSIIVNGQIDLVQQQLRDLYNDYFKDQIETLFTKIKPKLDLIRTLQNAMHSYKRSEYYYTDQNKIYRDLIQTMTALQPDLMKYLSTRQMIGDRFNRDVLKRLTGSFLYI